MFVFVWLCPCCPTLGMSSAPVVVGDSVYFADGASCQILVANATNLSAASVTAVAGAAYNDSTW